MNTNAVHMDPDPEFWPNLDPDPGLPYVINLKEKINLEKYNFLLKNIGTSF